MSSARKYNPPVIKQVCNRNPLDLIAADKAPKNADISTVSKAQYGSIVSFMICPLINPENNNVNPKEIPMDIRTPNAALISITLVLDEPLL